MTKLQKLHRSELSKNKNASHARSALGFSPDNRSSATKKEYQPSAAISQHQV